VAFATPKTKAQRLAPTRCGAEAMTGQELMLVHLGMVVLAVLGVALSLYRFINDRPRSHMRQGLPKKKAPRKRGY